MGDPSAADLAAYLAGTLPLPRFEEVDAWLADRPAEEQERLLGGAPAGDGLAPPASARATFATDGTAGRFVPRERIGAGGMGLVDLVYDRTLEREVALKRCRPRGPEESPDSHALRLRLFRREAAVTARLEHPGIVPIHDVGSGPAGEPAYLMKRLAGGTLAERGRLAVAEAADLLLRVADAIAFAHHRGVVHRDLKPEHVWLGADGEVQVLDWGLAGHVGSTIAANGALGTPPWRAPEQTAEMPADPRMDVWGLGGVLLFALTGGAPGTVEPPARGLGAIARRCLRPDPAERYPDGAAVAADLRRWLRDGLAAAEEPGPAARAWTWLRRHPAVPATCVALLIAAGAVAWNRHSATRTARGFLESPLPGAEALERWRVELSKLPATTTVERARKRIADVQQTAVVLATAGRWQRTGPWPGEITDLGAALRTAGIDPLEPRAIEALRHHPNRPALLRVLVHLQRALLVGRVSSPLTEAIPRLVEATAPDDAWRSLADLLTRPILRSHDLELCPCPESESALVQDDTADALLALYAPDIRLERLALTRIGRAPGAFWPRIVASRAALAANRITEARAHAQVALGADPTSMWPHLLLAYIALGDADQTALGREIAAGLLVNPDHLELKVLHAVHLARAGRLPEAQAAIAGLDEAPHLQHHLHQRTGNPMERSVDALIAAGVRIPDAPPAAGPVVHPH